MIHKWLNADRNKLTRDRNQSRAKGNTTEFGEFEQLEDKRLLAFVSFFDGVTLELTQFIDDGDALVENSTGQWTVTDNAGTQQFFVSPTNLIVNMLDNTANQLDLMIEMPHTGDVELNLGDGVRDVFFTGTLNEIGEDLTITAGDGVQQVTLTGDTAAPIIVRGSVDIDLGQDFDYVYSNAGVTTIEDDLFMTGVNQFEYSLMVGLPGPPPVPGDVTIDVSGEDIESFLIPTGGATIYGDFTYLGNVNIDNVDLTGANVTGDVNVDLNLGNPFFGGPQNVLVDGLVEGDVTITAGDSNLGNDIYLGGQFLGNIVSYTGGDLVDTVVYEMDGLQADVLVEMGGGDDTFELNIPVNLLEIDFGNDPGDLFINNLPGPIDFEYDITNYHFFDFFYTALDDTLRINQLEDKGDTIIDNGSGDSGFDWRVQTALAGDAIVPRAQNLILSMLPNTGANLDVDLINNAGSTTLLVGDGARTIRYIGATNNVLRDVVITAGAGDQVVDLSVNALLGAATLDVDLGTGFDEVNDNANALIIGEDLLFTGVNDFVHDGLLTVFRNVLIDNSGEAENSVFSTDGSLFVGSQFQYSGGGGSDEVSLEGIGGVEITLDTIIDLGDSTVGNDQYVRLNGPDTVLGGNLMVTSTNAVSSDTLVAGTGTDFRGDLSLDLGGGSNFVDLLGNFDGTSINYVGGSGPDIISYDLTGSPALLDFTLGAGDDSFFLSPTANIASPLIIDFGTGDDTFTNGYGAFTFDAQLWGLNGFNHEYVLATDTLTSTHVEDLGDVTVDDNGASAAIRFTDALTGTTNELTPVSNLIINMADNTGNLEVDLDSPLAGDLEVNLGDGARILNLTGTDNSIGGNLQVTAGSGNQTVNVAVNNQITVGGDAVFDLGTGQDIVEEDGNDVAIGGNLNLTGVNFLENDGNMGVLGDVLVDNTGEDEFSIFDDDGAMSLFGNFTYLGGVNADQIDLNGLVATLISGDVWVDMGDNTSAFAGGVIFNADTTIGGNLTVTSTASAASNFDYFYSDAGATLNGNITIDFGDGANDANIIGVFGGTDITYTGGSGVDTVTFGTTGAPADVVINLGADDDTFTLLAGASIDPTTLTVDFGTGDDTFDNQYGAFDFNAQLWNLDGFNHDYDVLVNELISTQVAPFAGTLTVDNNGAGDAIRFIDGGIAELTPVDFLTVNMLDGGGNDLNLRLDNIFSGDITLNLGDGTRAVTLDGISNMLDELKITAGDGFQTLELSDSQRLQATGDVSIHLGLDNDFLTATNGFLVDDLFLTNVNLFENNADSDVGGNLIVDNAADNVSSTFDDNADLLVLGDFTYYGNANRDVVNLDGVVGTSLGKVDIDLGDNTFTGTQSVTLGLNSVVLGPLTVKSIATANPDLFLSAAGTTFADDININLGGGTNSATILGSFAGSSVLYNGKDGSDTVSLGTTGSKADANIKLKGGDDTFTLETGAAVDQLRVDFGGGDDAFNNNYGAYDFDAKLLNWHGYNRFYDVLTDSLNMEQVLDTGNLTVDNNGASDAIRLINGDITEMTPATNVRLVMLNNTSPVINVDMDNAHTGDFILNTKNGIRVVNFTGDSNDFGGLLRVEMADGNQTVNLAVNANLNVGASLVVNGRDGSDTVDDGANNINVAVAMLLRGINNFVNDNVLTVGGDFNMVSSLETQDTNLGNNGSISVGGNLTYLGAGGVDRIQLAGSGATIGGYTYVNLAFATDFFSSQIVSFLNGFSTTALYVDGGNSLGGNDFATDASTLVSGDVTVNFTGSSAPNTATFLGTYLGTYGTFRGGSSGDTVVFGAFAPAMLFATLVFAGNDQFTVEATTDLDFLYIDFGTGSDTLIDNLGQPWPFGSTILNL